MLHKYFTGTKYYTKTLTKVKNQMKYFQFAFLTCEEPQNRINDIPLLVLVRLDT